jgi:hypothetical protein
VVAARRDHCVTPPSCAAGPAAPRSAWSSTAARTWASTTCPVPRPRPRRGHPVLQGEPRPVVQQGGRARPTGPCSPGPGRGYWQTPGRAVPHIGAQAGSAGGCLGTGPTEQH